MEVVGSVHHPHNSMLCKHLKIMFDIVKVMRYWHRPAHESRKHLHTYMLKALRDLCLFFFCTFGRLLNTFTHSAGVCEALLSLALRGEKSHINTSVYQRLCCNKQRVSERRMQDSLARLAPCFTF